MMSSADQEAYRHFKDTLEADLRQNIKPVIISLTMLAEDYKQSSQMIAKSIEEYILNVPADIKILGLYLMDSIMKNLKYTTNYTTIFERSMVNLFLRVFECVDEQNRKALYKLRQTWNEVFSNRILFDIDVSVKKIDPAWPITANLQQKTTQQQTNDPYQVTDAKSSPPTSNKSILINQTNIINPANSQSVQQVVQQSPSATKISNGTNSMLTTTSIKSQELNKQQQQVAQQPQRSSPNLINKESIVKKQLEFTKKATDDSSAESHTIRDPRLAQRKTKPCTTQTKSDSIDTPPTLTNTSPTLLKKKQTNDKQCLKRSSPSSSSIQNVHEIKKAKLTPPLNGDKISPNKPLISPNKQNVNSKLSTSPPTQKQTQQINKIPKLLNNEDDESKKLKLKPRPDDLKQQTAAKTVTAPRLLNKIEKPSDDVKKQVKTIPSLFDIQLDPPTASLIKKQTSNSDLKQKQFNKTGVQQQQLKSKTQQQQPINKQQTVKPIAKKQSPCDLKASSNETKTLQKKTVKVNDSKKSTDDFIFGNDEDVDERFSNGSSVANKTPKTDDITQQLRKLNDLISTTPTIIPTPVIATTSTKPATSDLLSILFDSNNKLEPNVLALITAQKTQATSVPVTPALNPMETLANNKQSLNELEQKLIISKQNDQVNNETKTSTNTQELVDMIQTLIKQQQMLLDQQSRKEFSPAVTNLIDEFDESQNVSNNNENEEEIEEQQDDFDHADNQQQSYYDQIATYNELPPIKPRDKNENQNDSLLIIDGRSYRIQPEVRRLIKVYYHDHELFCDTRTKEVFVDQKRVYKMGEPTKEIMLNGRRVRLMYMGRRIEIWIDGLSYHFRADSPPKQISISSSTTNQIKRYYVTIDSRTMDMFFDNYKVCQINGGPHGSGQTKLVQLAPNDFEYHEISFVCPPKRIMIDGMPRTMRYDLPVPCIEMESGRFHVIRFSGKPREIYIDEIPYLVPFDKTIRIKLNGRAHELAWGGPGFEVIIDGRPYELQFNKPSREIVIGTRPHFIYICGDAPDVKICGQLPYELLKQKQEEDEMETEQSKIIKSLPSLMQPIQNNFMMTQPMSSNQQPSSLMQQNKTPNLQELFQSLVEHKLIKPVPKRDKETKLSSLDSLLKNLLPQQQQTEEIEKLPDLTNFDADLLKKTYTGAIQSLYSGHQCATCGNRFNQNETGTNNSRYRKHLDWHFRQNRKEKDEVNKAHSRDWYYILQDWIQFEELSEDSANNSQNENDKQTDRNNGDSNSDDIDMNHGNNGMSKNSINAFSGVTTCPATDDIDDKCYVCLDPFEIFFHEEKDEWHFKDAIRVDSRVFHPICFEDAREDQSFNNRSVNDESMVTETNTRVKDEPTVNTSQSQDQIMMSQTDEQMPELQQSTEMVLSQNERAKSSQKDNHLKNEPKTP